MLGSAGGRVVDARDLGFKFEINLEARHMGHDLCKSFIRHGVTLT